MLASGAFEKGNIMKTAILLHCAGPQVVEIYDTFIFENDDDKNDPKIVLEKLEIFLHSHTK